MSCLQLFVVYTTVVIYLRAKITQYFLVKVPSGHGHHRHHHYRDDIAITIIIREMIIVITIIVNIITYLLVCLPIGDFTITIKVLICFSNYAFIVTCHFIRLSIISCNYR